jgi:glycosyltransferase involved in cell wall biosynthesis
MACGQAAGEWMFQKHKFIVLNNAVDVSKFHFDPSVRNTVRSELGIADDELVIGNVGRFSVPKNHNFIIEIFNRLQITNSKAKLVLVGNDSGPDCAPIANAIKQKIHSLSLDDKVIFTGTQSDVARYLMAMDIFLLPSLYEGFPVTTVEAQATGLECFVSDKVPADCMITELVHQFSLNEPADLWASRIVDVYTRSARRDHSQEIIDAGFDISHNAKWLEDYYVGKLENQ